MKQKAVLAIDPGGSKLAVGLMDKDGNLIGQTRHKWSSNNQKEILAQMFACARQTLKGHPAYKIIAAGVTVPGLADPKNGIWLTSALGEIRNLPIVKLIKENLGLPAYIENDGNACALAEKYFGGGRDCQNFLYITLSTGVGGGLILNDKLYTGHRRLAGEIGAMVVERNINSDKNGKPGVLQSYACTSGLVRAYLEHDGHLLNDRSLNGEILATQADRGEKAALAAFALQGKSLGYAIAAAATLLDIEKVILGGGLSLAFQYIRDALWDTLAKEMYKLPQDFSVEPTILGYYGGLVAAGTIALLGAEIIC